MVKDQSDTQMKLIEAQGDLDSINQQVANSDTPPLVAQAVDQDPQILTMRNQVDSLEMSLATFDPNNPQSQKYKAMRDRMQAKLDDRILELTSKYTTRSSPWLRTRSTPLRRAFKASTSASKGPRKSSATLTIRSSNTSRSWMKTRPLASSLRRSTSSWTRFARTTGRRA